MTTLSITEKAQLAKAITEEVCTCWQELEGRYGEEARFETKTSIFMAVIDVLENGVDC